MAPCVALFLRRPKTSNFTVGHHSVLVSTASSHNPASASASWPHDVCKSGTFGTDRQNGSGLPPGPISVRASARSRSRARARASARSRSRWRARERESKRGRERERERAREEGRKEGRKEASKEGSKEARKQGSKEARKQGSKEARKQGSKEGRKEGRQAGREGGREGREGGINIFQANISQIQRGKHLASLPQSWVEVQESFSVVLAALNAYVFLYIYMN